MTTSIRGIPSLLVEMRRTECPLVVLRGHSRYSVNGRRVHPSAALAAIRGALVVLQAQSESASVYILATTDAGEEATTP